MMRKLTSQSITAKPILEEVVALFLAETGTTGQIYQLVMAVSESALLSIWTAPSF
jgi:putative Ca2+/H+ antiporter (TMEM165/GDT1 family)